MHQPRILEQDAVARAWEMGLMKAELGGAIRICLFAGPLLGLLAIFAVSRIGDGEVPRGFVFAALLLPAALGLIILLNG